MKHYIAPVEHYIAPVEQQKGQIKRPVHCIRQRRLEAGRSVPTVEYAIPSESSLLDLLILLAIST